MTRWLPIPGWDFYEVSDDGQVRSLDKMMNNRWGGKTLKPGRILKQMIHRGYKAVILKDSGRSRTVKVHTLVLESFVSPRPLGLVGRHLDGNESNNSLPNLRWGTHSENNLDRVRHGTHHNSIKTTCPEGHEYDYTTPSGGRRCKRCSAKRLREFRKRHKK